MRLLIDTNVILDVLLARPGGEASRKLLRECQGSQSAHQAFVAWHTLPTVFYLCERQLGSNKAWELVRDSLQVFTVVTCGHGEVVRATSLGLRDFEDALQVVAAEAARADRIVTRNGSDFSGSPIPAVAPEAFGGATS